MFRYKTRNIEVDKCNYIISYENLISVCCLSDDMLTNKSKHLLLRNTFESSVLDGLAKDVKILSFDIDDCKKHNLKFYNQYCSGANYIEDNKGKFKSKKIMYFLGLDKGRGHLLRKIKNKNTSLQSKFVIVESKSKGSSWIPYKEHLDNLLKSDIILDIVKEGQSSCTMKTIEAVFANKKVLTNNKNIVEMEIYSPERFYIIDDEESLLTLPDRFIDNDIDEVPTGLLNEFRIENVIKKIIIDEEVGKIETDSTSKKGD